MSKKRVSLGTVTAAFSFSRVTVCDTLCSYANALGRIEQSDSNRDLTSGKDATSRKNVTLDIGIGTLLQILGNAGCLKPTKRAVSSKEVLTKPLLWVLSLSSRQGFFPSCPEAAKELWDNRPPIEIRARSSFACRAGSATGT